MKKLRNLSLVGIAFLVLTSCGEPAKTTTADATTEAAVTTVEDITTAQTSYDPNVSLNVRAAKEVEVGQQISIKSIVSGVPAGGDKGVTYTGYDETIISIELSGTTGIVTGLKEGKTTVTITANANPTKTATATITVIPAKPSLRQLFKNVQQLESYTITTGVADSQAEEMVGEDGIIYVTDKTVVHTDYDGNPIIGKEEDKNSSYYGETVTADGDVVYITQKNGKFVTDNAPVVQTNAGLLNADNFRGFKEEALQPDEVGLFYSYDALNPEWFTDEKTEDNKYTLEGHVLDDETGLPSNIGACYAEAVLWELINKESFDKAVATLQEPYYYALSGLVKTTLFVTGANTVDVMIELDNNDAFMATMSDVNETTLDNEINEIGAIEGFVAAAPVQGEKFEEGVEAINTNNYIQANSVFPDHETECTYFTYFTPNYVFYDCNEVYRDKYNSLTTEDRWEQIPYGFAKKADGIYKFEYNEPGEGEEATAANISWAEAPEEGTDANTDLATYAKYFSTIKTFTTDLKYAFGTEEASIWNGRSTKYYSARSWRIYYDFTNYYAPEDVSDCIEIVQVGFSVTKKEGVVTKVEGTMGAAPFDASRLESHTYGVNYFAIENFGAGTNNVVNDLLGL